MTMNPQASASPTLGFTDDCFYCIEWAQATKWFDQLEGQQPLMTFHPRKLRRLLYRALALAAAGGVNISLIWSLEDLVRPDVVRTVVTEAAALMPYFDRIQLAFLLNAVARDWVKAPEGQLEQLKLLVVQVSRQAPAGICRRRRYRLADVRSGRNRRMRPSRAHIATRSMRDAAKVPPKAS
ncbi:MULTISPECIES: hypothetical protein [Pseudorhizobium]|uniref:Uncharacterized protein n=1 Tax=Pseudorhizobium halotolerans TaxID=1233081 RepID=A0ABN7JRF3_9HYPH|nr:MULTISPECIES: hypothetical protein [Pseudorhizobium]CAD7044363.1 hypothetical protein RHAB21_03434 [Pseudorhizobium halotolerans]